MRSTMTYILRLILITLLGSPQVSSFFQSNLGNNYIHRQEKAFRSVNMSNDEQSSFKPQNIVVVGAGIQGTSVAYHLFNHPIYRGKDKETKPKITLLEAKSPASAASGKGGGFMARSWGDGSPTQALHEVSFDLYKDLATQLNCESYRTVPVLSVAPGYNTNKSNKGNAKGDSRNASFKNIIPTWLDGSTGSIRPLGLGDDTAQITPKEFVDKMIHSMEQENNENKFQIILGKCSGVVTEELENGTMKIVGVKYRTDASESSSNNVEEHIIPADTIIVSAGPWSCQAEDWFDNVVSLPMEGVKSTSIVWKSPTTNDAVDGTALFCGEDSRFGTHLEVYPRPDNTIYICGIGGSDYITKEELKEGAYLQVCEANESRVDAACKAFQTMSSSYDEHGVLDKVQACMRPCPPDAMPYMGPIPGFTGAYINAGHNCWGIAWAPGCGLAMAELVLEGESKSIDLAPFDPSRYTPKSSQRGGRGRKRRGETVGEQW